MITRPRIERGLPALNLFALLMKRRRTPMCYRVDEDVGRVLNMCERKSEFGEQTSGCSWIHGPEQRRVELVKLHVENEKIN
jgi:hypothetical protein